RARHGAPLPRSPWALRSSSGAGPYTRRVHISAATSAATAGTREAAASAAGESVGPGVPTGGSDWTLICFGGFGVAVAVAAGVAAGAVVAAAVCRSRGTFASGSVLRESAA